MSAVSARINAIATTVPALDMDAAYRTWAARHFGGNREGRLFDRMAVRSGIEHRWTVLSEADLAIGSGYGLYGSGRPSTAARMALYREAAPALALEAIAGLPSIDGVTHLVVASCTGFCAPGVDQIIARQLGLAPGIERTLIGFMGCYGGAIALRTARHIVRSEPTARVLVVTVELCSLHFQLDGGLASVLAMAQFGDGAAAALVSGHGSGIGIEDGISSTLDDAAGLITWTIGDTGFLMELSGEVPGRITAALQEEQLATRLAADEVDSWGVHAGGRSIIDAVEQGLDLPPHALENSRAVLRDYGNTSSATLLFVLKRVFEQRPERGIAIAFGPGLAIEGFRYRWIEGDAG